MQIVIFRNYLKFWESLIKSEIMESKGREKVENEVNQYIFIGLYLGAIQN